MQVRTPSNRLDQHEGAESAPFRRLTRLEIFLRPAALLSPMRLTQQAGGRSSGALSAQVPPPLKQGVLPRKQAHSMSPSTARSRPCRASLQEAASRLTSGPE